MSSDDDRKQAIKLLRERFNTDAERMAAYIGYDLRRQIAIREDWPKKIQKADGKVVDFDPPPSLQLIA